MDASRQAAYRNALEIARDLPPLDEAQRYSIEEGRGYLRLSRPTLYGKIASGEIKTIIDGYRRYIPGSEIARLSRIGGHG